MLSLGDNTCIGCIHSFVFFEKTTGQPLLLEHRQREADCKEAVNDQGESNLLLRIQVEDLQRRLEEKGNKLTQAQEVRYWC